MYYDLQSDGESKLTVSRSNFPVYFINRDGTGWYVMPNKVGRMSSRATHTRVKDAIRPYLKGDIALAIQQEAAAINWKRTPPNFFLLDADRDLFRPNHDLSDDTLCLLDSVAYWCREQFGRPSTRRWQPNHGDDFGAVKIYDPTLATAFRLRWC